jgi:hypothetical protein
MGNIHVNNREVLKALIYRYSYETLGEIVDKGLEAGRPELIVEYKVEVQECVDVCSSWLDGTIVLRNAITDALTTMFCREFMKIRSNFREELSKSTA